MLEPSSNPDYAYFAGVGAELEVSFSIAVEAVVVVCETTSLHSFHALEDRVAQQAGLRVQRQDPWHILSVSATHPKANVMIQTKKMWDFPNSNSVRIRAILCRIYELICL